MRLNVTARHIYYNICTYILMRYAWAVRHLQRVRSLYTHLSTHVFFWWGGGHVRMNGVRARGLARVLSGAHVYSMWKRRSLWLADFFLFFCL